MTLISDIMIQLNKVHPTTYTFLKKYLSPSYETSLFKGIPITEESLAHVKVLKGHLSLHIRFRGPRPAVSAVGQSRHRYNRQSYCLQCDAKTMSIYTR